ncbi:MAG TPA: hypothetical protein VHY08_17175 [Bacillota bacterium]|nr:hypothetical protein [Bacillota bacterium]
MKKGIFGLIMVLGLVMVIIAGCGGGSDNPTHLGPTPTPTPIPEVFPNATTDYSDSGATGYALAENVLITGDDGSTWGNNNIDDTVGAFGTLATKSDKAGMYLYVKISFAKVGTGRMVCLLIDDTAQTSGFPVNGQYTQYLPWEGSFGLQIPNFDPDLGIGAQRNWGPVTWQSTKAFTYTGPSQNDNTPVNAQCTITDITDGGGTANSVYEFKIPYSVIGADGAQSGAKLKIVALLGRGTYSDNAGTFVTARPLGASSTIPGDAVTLTDSGQSTVRIGTVGSYVKCTLD